MYLHTPEHTHTHLKCLGNHEHDGTIGQDNAKWWEQVAWDEACFLLNLPSPSLFQLHS